MSLNDKEFEDLIREVDEIANQNSKKQSDHDDEEDDGAGDAWVLELETALLSDCDINVVRRISNHHSIPTTLRNEYWQVCLGVKGRTKLLEDIFDLFEQALIRSDCERIASLLDNSSDEKLSIQSDLESIVTNFSKLNNCSYRSDNGWLDLLIVLLHLNAKKDELFKVFETIELRYIPKYYNSSGGGDDEQTSDVEQRSVRSLYMQPFHMLRLLLLYHDPELCNHFDTMKVTMNEFADTWLRSLFCKLIDSQVSLVFFDNYFTYANSFLIFFISLVMIVNLKEELIKCKDDREALVRMLKTIPSSLRQSDVDDMFMICEKHFLERTPVSIQYFQKLFFQVATKFDDNDDLVNIRDLSGLLCLPIDVQELIDGFENSKDEEKKRLKYFVVDCRTPEQYNNGHLSTAFHLDSNLMLNDPSAFNTAVEALLASQEQAMNFNSIAGGEHLCFLGTGNKDEDGLVHMVISSFLQRHNCYVSQLYGGYDRLHRYLFDKQLVDKYLVDHNWAKCLPCNQRTSSHASTSKSSLNQQMPNLKNALFSKLNSVMKPRFNEMKVKLAEYVGPNARGSEGSMKHVSSGDRLGKRYKGHNQFTLVDTDDGEDDEEDFNEAMKKEMLDDEKKEVNVEEWKEKNEIEGCWKCSVFLSNNQMIPGYLAVNDFHLFILQQSSSDANAKLLVKRQLERVIQITSKKLEPNLITFRYGDADDHLQPNRSTRNGDTKQAKRDKDSVLIEKPFDVIRLIKHKIIQVLDTQTTTTSAND